MRKSVQKHVKSAQKCAFPLSFFNLRKAYITLFRKPKTSPHGELTVRITMSL